MQSDLGAIMSLEVPLIVVLGERRLRLSEVVALVPGAIIELPKGAEEELELLVNNKAIGTGVAVKVGENFGIRITYVGNLKLRIAALGAGGRTEGAGTPTDAEAAAMLAGQV